MTLSNGRHHYNAILKDLDVLAENDGHAEWRVNEAKALSSIVQVRGHSLITSPKKGLNIQMTFKRLVHMYIATS